MSASACETGTDSNGNNIAAVKFEETLAQQLLGCERLIQEFEIITLKIYNELTQNREQYYQPKHHDCYDHHVQTLKKILTDSSKVSFADWVSSHTFFFEWCVDKTHRDTSPAEKLPSLAASSAMSIQRHHKETPFHPVKALHDRLRPNKGTGFFAEDQRGRVPEQLRQQGLPSISGPSSEMSYVLTGLTVFPTFNNLEMRAEEDDRPDILKNDIIKHYFAILTAAMVVTGQNSIAEAMMIAGEFNLYVDTSSKEPIAIKFPFTDRVKMYMQFIPDAFKATDAYKTDILPNLEKLKPDVPEHTSAGTRKSM